MVRSAPDDIDLLFEAVRAPSTDPDQNTNFDINADGTLSAEDIDAYLTGANVLRGDFDLDQSVTFGDFLVLSANFGFGQEGGWSDGDATGDGKIDFADFLLLAENFGDVA